MQRVLDRNSELNQALYNVVKLQEFNCEQIVSNKPVSTLPSFLSILFVRIRTIVCVLK